MTVIYTSNFTALIIAEAERPLVSNTIYGARISPNDASESLSTVTINSACAEAAAAVSCAASQYEGAASLYNCNLPSAASGLKTVSIPVDKPPKRSAISSFNMKRNGSA